MLIVGVIREVFAAPTLHYDRPHAYTEASADAEDEDSCQSAVMAQAPNRIPTPMVKAETEPRNPKVRGAAQTTVCGTTSVTPIDPANYPRRTGSERTLFSTSPDPYILAPQTTYPVSRRGGRRCADFGKTADRSARHPSRMTGRIGLAVGQLVVHLSMASAALMRVSPSINESHGIALVAQPVQFTGIRDIGVVAGRDVLLLTRAHPASIG